MNRAVVQRLRAEVQSDLTSFQLRVRELEGTHPDESDAGACALTAVALHHADAVTLDARRLDALRVNLQRATPGILEDFAAVDRWLAGVADGLSP